MKFVFGCINFFLCTVLIAQSQQTKGKVYDKISKEVLIGAHIKNISKHLFSISDYDGSFQLTVSQGDTLVFSYVSYKDKIILADSKQLVDNSLLVFLTLDTVSLKEVEIRQFPEYGEFKKLISTTKVKDSSFQVYGLPKVVIRGDPLLEKRNVRSVGLLINNPISYLYHNFGKREKEKRKMHEVDKSRQVRFYTQNKLEREWIAEVVQLRGKELTDFISFCSFSEAYIVSTPKYDIHLKIIELLTLYKKNLKEHISGDYEK